MVEGGVIHLHLHLHLLVLEFVLVLLIPLRLLRLLGVVPGGGVLDVGVSGVGVGVDGGAVFLRGVGRAVGGG